ARASQQQSGVRAIASVSTPIPSSRGAVSTPIPTPTPAVVTKRAAEAGKEDSGIVDLNLIRAMATPQQKAAAGVAQPAAAGLFEEDEAAAPAAAAAARAPAAVRAPEAAPAKKRGSGGAVAGFLIATLGIAAAAGIVAYKKHLYIFKKPVVAAETP